jgi:predicted enzyme related to lactoylglutathione lyase
LLSIPLSLLFAELAIAVVETIAKLEALGGKLEGRIREPFFGKVAAVRSPEGHLLSLLQPKDL